MGPISPFEINSFTALNSEENKYVWSTKISQLESCDSAISLSLSDWDNPNGFSTNTCFPCFNASTVWLACWLWRVVINTKSEEKPDKEEKDREKSKIDGLNYLYDYVPKISTANIYEPAANQIFEEEYRTIIK